jgi:hypothetical protein
MGTADGRSDWDLVVVISDGEGCDGEIERVMSFRFD